MGPNCDPATGSDDPRRGAETLRVRLPVAHAVTVGLELVESAAGVLKVCDLERGVLVAIFTCDAGGPALPLRR